jgi:hypothetical protein
MKSGHDVVVKLFPSVVSNGCGRTVEVALEIADELVLVEVEVVVDDFVAVAVARSINLRAPRSMKDCLLRTMLCERSSLAETTERREMKTTKIAKKRDPGPLHQLNE